ncbi:MAG: hypothetical protein AABZ57_01445, partial [Candidatus Margulisiibacteriota bacterium]
IYYGFSMEKMFIRIDTSVSLDCRVESEMKSISFELDIIKPKHYKVTMFCGGNGRIKAVLYKLSFSGRFEINKEVCSVEAKRIIEIGIDFKDLEIAPKAEVNFAVAVKKDDKELERWPKGGIITFNCPDEEFESESWFV